MVKVMASGVFDIIHLGHISYLEQAKKYGDELVAVVACDSTVRKKKHEPITPEHIRAKIINALKPVDRVVVGKDGDIFDIVQELEPDIIVLGYDQLFDEEELRTKLKSMGMGNIKIVRANECADDLNATRRIINKIRNTESLR